MKKNTKKSYTFRLDPSLIKQLDQTNYNRTAAINAAIQMYVNPELQKNDNSNTEAIQILKDLNDFLKGQVTFLQRENSYLSKPWYQRLLLPKPK